MAKFGVGRLFATAALSVISTAALAAELLYIRSHWLRMPPLMLARHLSVKAWARLRT